MVESNEHAQLREALEFCLEKDLERILLSNPSDPDHFSKSKIRPLLLKGNLIFQAEEQKGKQAFHKNLSRDEAVIYVENCLNGPFRQAEITCARGKATVLVSKKGKMTVKFKKQARMINQAALEHNRKKQYLLPEGTAVPFLVDLGVMTKEGTIVHSRYDKYRQINRFLEFIEDILPQLNKNKENVIIDFGCGKSYLTFAMYYYLKEVKGYPVRIIGLDLKEDVICHCSDLAVRYGYEKLSFTCGDIASYEGVDHVDMVVTLHACDLATDYALEKAVGWGAKVILSVPCCQHELNRQIHNPVLQPVLEYGLLKERMAALYTDGEQAASEEGFSFVISDSSVADYGNIENTDNGTKITIKAKNEGTATLTVTDNATGKKAYGTISVSDGYFNIAANAMPVYKEGKDEYNCYTSGMYITDFKQEIINDDYNLVTMNVYNETSVIGVVEVYDSNGKLVKCEKIDKFGGNNITSLKGTVLSSLLLLQDAFTQNMLSFKSERFTKKTSISISVPRGGYIKVSNNINDSAYCTVYNFVDMLVFVWKEVGNIQKSDNMEVALRDKLVETFTSQMKEETFNFLVKEARTILSVSATMGDAKQHVNEVAESLNKVIQTLDINIGDLILNTMIDVGYSVEQKAYNELITITGFPKASLDLVFKIGKYGNFLTQIVQTAQCAYSNVLRIDTTNAQNELIDNGVKVDAGSSGGFVMRSYQVTEGEEYNAAQNALSAISDKFKVYDIYIEKR